MSINQFQPPNNWLAETGIALFLLGLFSGEKLGFATAVLLAVFDRETGTSLAHTADGHTPAVAGPKPLSVAGNWLRNVMAVRGCGCAYVCPPVSVSRQVFPLPSFGIRRVFPTENTESKLCAKIVGFQEQLYCVLSKSIGLE